MGASQAFQLSIAEDGPYLKGSQFNCDPRYLTELYTGIGEISLLHALLGITPVLSLPPKHEVGTCIEGFPDPGYLAAGHP